VPIASGIARKLLAPEDAVGDRDLAVDGTLMPEATVDEYGKTLVWEHKVGVAIHGRIPPPPRDLMGAKYAD